MFLIDASMKKFTQNSNFSTFHDLQSDLKVLEMGCKVKKILRGQCKPCLWVFNLKTGNFYHWTVKVEFDEPFLEPCLPYSPLMGNLNKHHMKVTGLLYRFHTYTIFVSMLSISRDTNILMFWLILVQSGQVMA